MKFLLGKKEGMTQVFDEQGRVHAVTVVRVPTAVVTQVKTVEKDGYAAAQIGAFPIKETKVNKAQRGKGLFSRFKELRSKDAVTVAVGDTIALSVFAPGDVVTVSGTSKGKGFQGVVKRHGFAGGRRTHGQKHSEREPGSIGATAMQRVLKGVRMGGRMGGDRVTIQNLKIVAVDEKAGTLLIAGAIPGRRGSELEIRG
jgi:large subunit ribosomal protein L3